MPPDGLDPQAAEAWEASVSEAPPVRPVLQAAGGPAQGQRVPQGRRVIPGQLVLPGLPERLVLQVKTAATGLRGLLDQQAERERRARQDLRAELDLRAQQAFREQRVLPVLQEALAALERLVLQALKVPPETQEQPAQRVGPAQRERKASQVLRVILGLLAESVRPEPPDPKDLQVEPEPPDPKDLQVELARLGWQVQLVPPGTPEQRDLQDQLAVQEPRERLAPQAFRVSRVPLGLQERPVTLDLPVLRASLARLGRRVLQAQLDLLAAPGLPGHSTELLRSSRDDEPC